MIDCAGKPTEGWPDRAQDLAEHRPRAHGRAGHHARIDTNTHTGHRFAYKLTWVGLRARQAIHLVDRTRMLCARCYCRSFVVIF